MPRGKVEGSKMRVIAVYNFIINSKKRCSCSDILRHLDLVHGITADRKTIVSDIASIDRIVPIISFGGRNGGYEVHRWEGMSDD